MTPFYPARRTANLARDRQLVIRQDEREHLLWENWAYQRGLTVSDLVRKAVAAYAAGEVGVPFAATCAFSERHVPGRTCPGCGGSARASA
jgi:hypothetical protein